MCSILIAGTMYTRAIPYIHFMYEVKLDYCLYLSLSMFNENFPGCNNWLLYFVPI